MGELNLVMNFLMVLNVYKMDFLALAKGDKDLTLELTYFLTVLNVYLMDFLALAMGELNLVMESMNFLMVLNV